MSGQGPSNPYAAKLSARIKCTRNTSASPAKFAIKYKPPEVTAAVLLLAAQRPSAHFETTASANNPSLVKPFGGETDIFIYPGYRFKAIDALITNFHLPKSTLLMLVCAFVGYERTMAAYQAAIAARYRFFSYGDAMFII